MAVQPAGSPWPVASAAACAQGRRPSMEDRHVTAESLWSAAAHVCKKPDGLPPCAFYAVFDGHGGVRAAKVAASTLYVALAKQLYPLGANGLEDGDLVTDAIVGAFERTEAEIAARAHAPPRADWEDGSTACSVILLGRALYAANLGDSRAVLSRAGVALPLTVDHKPGDPSELERIQRAGGFVRIVAGIERLMGDLSVSRGFGDVEYKPDLVSAVPDVRRFEVQDTDEFIIIACDGLWDVLSPEEAVECAHKLFRRARGQPSGLDQVAAGLVQRALASVMCEDNVSVVVIALSPFLAAWREPVGTPAVAKLPVAAGSAGAQPHAASAGHSERGRGRGGRGRGRVGHDAQQSPPAQSHPRGRRGRGGSSAGRGVASASSADQSSPQRGPRQSGTRHSPAAGSRHGPRSPGTPAAGSPKARPRARGSP